LDVDYVVLATLFVVVCLLIVGVSARRLRGLRSKAPQRWRRIAERVVLIPLGLIAAVLACTATYSAVVIEAFRMRNPPPGESYLVDGHKMFMHCMGSGSPTVILEAGLGNDNLIWGAVQPELAQTTRVCAYDRAGFGWSDARPGPRDADHIAAELHGLLQQAHFDGPIILMGHSIAGIYLRDYATRYPENLVGMVFLDGSTPWQDRAPAMKEWMASLPPIWLQVELERALLVAGVPRLMGQCDIPLPHFDPQWARLQDEDICLPGIGASEAEMNAIDDSGTETSKTGPYGALPFLILSQDPAKAPPREPKAMVIAWQQMQEDLKKLSTRSRRIIAVGSTHYIQIDRPDLVNREVLLFIQQVRGTAPQPTNYGTTGTE
jgi:pimeloyl-ACP methyl ester carboxylesterase